MSGRVVGGDSIPTGLVCRAYWYTGLLCLGLPIGISPALVYGLDPGPCSNLNRLPQIPPPNYPPNPPNVQGAYSLEMICTEP